MMQIDALYLLLQIHSIAVCPAEKVRRIWCTVGKMQPQYESMHTREQSVPSVCSRWAPPSPCPCAPLTQHTVHVKGPKKHIICQCTNLHNEHQRKKDIFTPQNGVVFNKHCTSHENTVKKSFFKLVDNFCRHSETIGNCILVYICMG